MLIIIGLFLFRVNRFSLRFQETQDIFMEYGMVYQDSVPQVKIYGSHVLRNGLALNLPVVTEGAVDSNRVGNYTVCYRSEFMGLAGTVTRTIHVIDTQEPTLTLAGEASVPAVEGTMPEDPGCYAWDDYDGDISHRIEIVIDGDIMRYTVSDSSGNSVTAERTIIWLESDKPMILLNGDEIIYMDAGSAFIDPGFQAMDYTGADIFHLVEVEGEVDGFHAGSYTITYSVTDNRGNNTKIQRVVVVRGKNQPEITIPAEKVIYLTFDDGPGPYTQALLEVLAEYDVQATFFVINNSDYTYLLREMVAQGHTVGIHSMTHNYRSIYASEEAFFTDMLGMQAIIYEQTGVETTLLRFPGGSSNMVSSFNEGIMTSLTDAVTDAGFQYYDWNVDSNDAGGATTAEEVFINVIAGIEGKRYAIVLQHDIKPYSVEAVEQIIIWGLENGYTFRALDPTSPTAHHNLNN